MVEFMGRWMVIPPLPAVDGGGRLRAPPGKSAAATGRNVRAGGNGHAGHDRHGRQPALALFTCGQGERGKSRIKGRMGALPDPQREVGQPGHQVLLEEACRLPIFTALQKQGHELQFAKMTEAGVSIPRAVFAFNSANVEGWALYAESFLKPYLPLEGQMGSLQMRLMRAARAFLDPMVNLGQVTPE